MRALSSRSSRSSRSRGNVVFAIVAVLLLGSTLATTLQPPDRPGLVAQFAGALGRALS